ncbi:MAG: PspA-associated protein PspAA [Solirubrobacteraceae bacterium]
MIVRISNEGQYELPASDLETLNELDNQAVAACQDADEAEFRAHFDRLLEFVRENGRRFPEDELSGSDLILPPSDVSLEEAQKEFRGEGLIPG